MQEALFSLNVEHPNNITMKLYSSKIHSDEDGPYADESKLGIVYSSKENVI